jgi:hypothetical protein
MIRKTARRGVNVPALAADSAAAAAHVSTGSSLDLVKDTVTLGRELCSDQV